MTTKEKRLELLDQHFKEKKTNKAGVAFLRTSDDLEPGDEEGRYMVLLNDIESVALGDSGADYWTILFEVFDALD